MSDLPVQNQQLTVSLAMMPVMSIEQALSRRNQMIQLTQAIMKEGTDFGIIPGTGDKPVLLKPGAEKLVAFFGLRAVPEVIKSEEDWTGKQHGGEPFFYYWYRYNLYKGDTLVVAADGSCNSWEKKYRWRVSSRRCPVCKKETIHKSRKDGGWFCWIKMGGCGANFPPGAPEIEEQEVGRAINEDVIDLVNTIQKMAQKRALIAAVLIGCGASEFYTQDMEDFDDGVIDVPATVTVLPKVSSQEAKGSKGTTVSKLSTPASKAAEPSKKINFTVFWPKVRSLGLSDAEIHALFGVTSMKEYSGDGDHAMAMLQILEYGIAQGLKTQDVLEALGVDTLVAFNGGPEEGEKLVNHWIDKKAEG